MQNKRVTENLSHMMRNTPTRYHDFIDSPFKDDYYGNEGAFIYGSVGSGKTTLAFQLAKRALMDDRGRVIRVTASELMQDLKDFGEKSTKDKIKKYQDIGILIIDDFGAQKKSEFSYECFYEIVNYRNEWRKFTLITSNVSLNEIDDRIASRIVQMCRLIHLSGEDLRLKGKHSE